MSFISEQQLKNSRRILYMTHLAIGDFVYQGVWLKALKDKYPHLIIDIWFDDLRSKPHDWAAGRNETLSQWIQAENIVDTIFPIASSLEERDTLVRRAQKRNYDLIVFIGKNRTEEFARYARLISATAYVVATKSKPWSRPLKKLMHFNKLDGFISYDQVASNVSHITELYAECFGKLVGLSSKDLAGAPMLKIKYEQNFDVEAREKLTALKSFHGCSRTIFINHLSTSIKKDYSWNNVIALIHLLHQQDPELAFLVNSPPDKYAEVRQAITSDTSLQDMAIEAFTATDNFFQLPAMMAQCDVVISVDTATTHLAACLGIPLLTLIADKDSLWTAQGEGEILTAKESANAIKPETIVAAFQRL